MDWEVLSEVFSKIQTIDDVGVKRTPLTIVEARVKGLPDTFISDLVLMVERSRV